MPRDMPVITLRQEARPSRETLIADEAVLAHARRRSLALARFYAFGLGVDVAWWIARMVETRLAHPLFASTPCVVFAILAAGRLVTVCFLNWQARNGGVAQFSAFLASGAEMWPQ